MGSRLNKRYVYNQTTGEMERVEEITRERGILTVGDLPDFVSPVDGTIVHGRAGLREHDKRNGTTNIADYTETWKKNLEKRAAFAEGRLSDPRRIETIVRAFNDLDEGRKKRRT